MNIIGVECGIGSMLIPSKELGYNIVANLETRRSFDTGTFEENFNAPFLTSYEQIPKKNIDILFSHPKCSEFSTLNPSQSKGKKLHEGFIHIVLAINKILPNFFLIENLPKSLEFYPLSWWGDQLKDYDISCELVSNFHYGNVQENRNRLHIIGSLKKFKFVFIPNERPNLKKLRHVIDGVENCFNHDLFPDEMKAPGFSPYSIEDVRSLLRYTGPGNTVFYKKEGNLARYSLKKKPGFKQRIGTMILDENGTCPTITSNLGFYLKDKRRPLTCRERARIQGCPDWFKFVFSENHKFSSTMGDQTGKFIPVEFVRYFTEFINTFLNGGSIESSGKRTLINKEVQISRYENCKKNSHSNLERLCTFCNFNECRLKM